MRYDKLMSVTLPVLTPLLFASTAFAQEGEAAATESTNALADAFANAGIIGWIIVLISVVSVALIIENFVSIKRDKLAPPDVINELEALFDEENFQEAMDLCEQEHMYLTNIVQAGLAKLGHTFDTIQTAVREMEEEETVKLFQKIGWLSLIAASAPMMGLLGTVTGMFVTFGEIAAAGGSVSPAQLAGGIKLALTTTIFGLCVALPTGAFFFVFRNRVVRTSIEINAIAEDLFERFRSAK
ncbi:MAG: MotA/TolQ/ExbB proton channel family protein [Planctomycetes bacterium]|nr:MotA/TolQ/ExbB proton channel family protein [Planctomycetota bacterium]